MTRGMQRFSTAVFLAAALAAALAPFAGRLTDGGQKTIDAFPGWPAQYEGRELTALPLSSLEESFARDFPGRTGRFRDGRRELILRWIDAPTRRLHSASDCFRGSGYGVTPQPARRDQAGRLMGCFRAQRGDERLTVCELIHDSASGASWPDVSAWFWHAWFAPARSSWWSYVVAERS